MIFFTYVFDNYNFSFVQKKSLNCLSFPSPKFQHKEGLNNSYWFVNHKLIRYVSFFYFLHSFFDTYEFFLLKFIYKNKISNYPSFPSPKFQHKKGLMNSYWFGNHVLIRYFIFFFAIISMIHFLYTLFLFWYIWIFWNQIWVH